MFAPRPRSLAEPSNLATRRAMLETVASVQPLREWSTDGARRRGAVAPDFDPADAGIAARVLFLLEAPGPMAHAGSPRVGSGFISCDNDDPTAETTWHARDAAGLHTGALHWNVVPWYLGPTAIKPNAAELAEGGRALRELLILLPDLAVVLLAGNYAQETLQRLDGEWQVGTPKSKRSTREVPLVNRALTTALRAYLVAHPHSGDPDALLWPGRMPGTHAVDYSRVFDGASFRRNYLRPALRALDMPEMRFHDLRHTFASLMLAAGFQPYEVSRWMGHASLVTTDTIYSHLYVSDYESHADRFDAFVATRRS